MSEQSTIVVIEDETQMRKFVHLALEAHGYRVFDAATGADGLLETAARSPALVLLDLGLPDIDGLEVTRRIREWTATPIIVISARGLEQQKVAALDAGADDYLTKPFGTSELMARIRVALRHAKGSSEPASAVLGVGDLKIDVARRIVHSGDREVHLTPTEYNLLTLLMRHAGRVMTHKQLLDQVWGPGHSHQMQYLRVYMTQLRHKLEKTPARPRYLLTEPGVGYRIKEQ